ncbi:MAG: hypothetical protein ACR2N4_19435 [Jatrophihabitans sp.]
MSIAVFDIDGVVADVRHRVHHIARRPKDWGRFFGAAAEDPGSDEGISWVLRAAQDHQIVWLTGRPEWLRRVTERWLIEQGLPVEELIMRGDLDHRPAALLKVAELRRLAARDIVVFVDDDPEVIQTAADAGFTASLATWLPRGEILAEAQDRAGRT